VTEEELQTEADAVKRKRDEEISACFERARKNLNGILRSKKQVIRDLADELERLGRPLDHIAAEIVHELRDCEELSKSLIYSYLDEKYKDPSHASRRKGKKTKNLVPETGTESAIQEAELAAEQEVLLQADTSGHSIQQPIAEAETEQESNHSTETGINSDTFMPDSVTIAQQEETASPPGIGSIGQQQQPVCKHCQGQAAIIKTQDAKIMELEEALAIRTHTSIKSAEELRHTSTDGYQQLQFSIEFETLRRRIVYPVNKPVPDRVWFNGKFNHKTGEVIDVRIGRTNGTDVTDTSRMTP
jgi:hypothetical protein